MHGFGGFHSCLQKLEGEKVTLGEELHCGQLGLVALGGERYPGAIGGL